MPVTDDDKIRFKHRHNYPYRRHPPPGDFGARRSTTASITSTTTMSTPTTKKTDQEYHSNFGFQPIETETESPKESAGIFVTMSHDDTENVTNIARQPKKAEYNDYTSGSNVHEFRVLPPEEFHHLLAKVDGVDRKVCSC